MKAAIVFLFIASWLIVATGIIGATQAAAAKKGRRVLQIGDVK